MATLLLTSSSAGQGDCTYEVRRLSLELGDEFLLQDTLHVGIILNEHRESGMVVPSPSETDYRELMWNVRSHASLEEFERILVKDDRGNTLLTLPITIRRPFFIRDPENLGWQAPGVRKCHRSEACYDGPLIEGQLGFEDLWKSFDAHGIRFEVHSKEGILVDVVPALEIEDWHRPYCS